MPQTESFSFLVLILIAGLLVKKGFDPRAFDSIPKLLFNLCMPALILTTFSGADSEIYRQDALFIAIFAVSYTIVIYPIALCVLRRCKNPGRKEILAFNMIVGNTSFVGLPFAAFFFGVWGVRLIILFSAVQDFFIWSLCYWVFAGKRSPGQTLKVILNPCFVAVLTGLTLAALQVALPDVVRVPVDMLAGMTVPLALLCIGSLLAQNTGALRNIDRVAVISVAIKILALPTVVFLVLTTIGINSELVLLATLITAFPSALLSVLFAKEFDKDIAFANVAFVLSTLTFILGCVALLIFT